MLQLQSGAAVRNCQGISRRTALKAGFLGLTGLSLADLFKLQARGLSPVDVMRAIDEYNLFLPTGDARFGDIDFRAAVKQEFAMIQSQIKPGANIAVAVGSRGI